MSHVFLLALLSVNSIAQTPPDFTLVDQDSVSWNLYQELGKGHTVLLDFFYAACVPCQTYTPEIEQVFLDYGAGAWDLVVLGISDRDDNATLAVFDSTYGVTYPSGGTQGNGNTITNLYMTYYSFFSWPKYAVICTDTSIFWEPTPSVGMADVRDKIDSCDIVTPLNEPVLPERAIRVYPNPASQNLNIALLNTGIAWTSVRLCNLHGEVVRQLDKRPAEPLIWEIEGLQAGYYLLYVMQGDKISTREKVVVL